MQNNNIEFIEYSNEQLELLEFNRLVNNFQSTPHFNNNIQTKEYVRSKLLIPCKYFIDRGFKPDTLNHFDVGLCLTKGSGAYMRATVPVYDDIGKNMIGYTARSINNKCGICNTYHYYKHPCPRNPAELNFARKWKNSEGFYSGATLYNIWNINGDTVVIVEGPGDVWKLYESGCQNAVALFGTNMTHNHIKKLVEKGILNVVLCLDNDEAGQLATKKIINQLEYYFNIEVLQTKEKDIGDTSINNIQNMLKGSKWQLLE